jgi:hypothetical protein
MYFSWNEEFGSALSKLRNFRGEGFEHTHTPSLSLGMPLLVQWQGNTNEYSKWAKMARLRVTTFPSQNRERKN